MCSQGDFPPYDPPEAKPPRRIVTAGDPLPRGSVALAILGDMLNEAEYALATVPSSVVLQTYVRALRRARDAVARVGG